MINEMSLLEFHKSLQVSAAEKGIPIFGGFELTPRCNLSCKMCYVKNKGANGEFVRNELSTKQWIELGRVTADNGALIVFLTGGEPLIRSDFKEIYESFNKLGLRLNLFTNGTLITEEFVRWLSQMPPSTVDVTLYGASGNTYLDLCGQEEAYIKARNGIELLLKYKINTRIKTTIVRRNKDDYDEIKGIAKSLGVEFISSNLIHGNRIDGIKDIEDVRLSPEEMYSSLIESVDEHDCSTKNIEQLKNSYKDLPAMFCTAGKSSFFINWQGNLVPCALFDIPYTEPLKLGFKAAWDMLREGVRFIPGALECSGCESRVFCPVCPGRLYLETGKFDKLSDYVCRLAIEKEKVFKCLST